MDKERAYENGARTAWAQMLVKCCRGLGYDSSETQRISWIAEREEAISALRSVCEEHGDNDWEPNLNLADIINKHLHRNLGEGQ